MTTLESLSAHISERINFVSFHVIQIIIQIQQNLRRDIVVVKRNFYKTVYYRHKYYYCKKTIFILNTVTKNVGLQLCI